MLNARPERLTMAEKSNTLKWFTMGACFVVLYGAMLWMLGSAVKENRELKQENQGLEHKIWALADANTKAAQEFLAIEKALRPLLDARGLDESFWRAGFSRPVVIELLLNLCLTPSGNYEESNPRCNAWVELDKAPRIVFKLRDPFEVLR